MPMESKFTNRTCRSCLPPLCLLWVVMVSCGSNDPLIGSYRAEVKDSPKQADTVLQLKAHGEGSWRVNDEEVPFSWYIKGSELRVNTMAGGVLVGTIQNGSILITLPGSKWLSLKRALP